MRRLLQVFALASLAGCYHATIETGAPASPEVLTKDWASGWIYGLVPPSAVSTAQRCASGVAKVETKLSFLNQLVYFLTLGIYTPMSIRVTCAGRRGDDEEAIKVGRERDTSAEALEMAVRRSLDTGKPVLVTLH